MSFLKNIIAQKKGEIKGNSSGNKWVKQGDLKKKQSEEYFKEQE